MWVFDGTETVRSAKLGEWSIRWNGIKEGEEGERVCVCVL